LLTTRLASAGTGDPQGGFASALRRRLGAALARLARRIGELPAQPGADPIELTQRIAERLEDIALLLETSSAFSRTLDLDHLLAIIAQGLAQTANATYCRIALLEPDGESAVVRAAHALHGLDWDPCLGDAMELRHTPRLRALLAEGGHAVVSREKVDGAEDTGEWHGILSPETSSAVIVAMTLAGRPQGFVILGETRSWKRAGFSAERVALARTLANAATTALSNARHYAELQEMLFGITRAMASAIDAKSPWTRGHSERVAHHAQTLGRELGLDEGTLQSLRLACLLHDIGKIGIDEAILDKPGRLDADELARIREHAVLGEAILRSIRPFAHILPVVRHHHERWDGAGYPDGLAGEAIPLLARITAVADTWDAMTAERPYRAVRSRPDAIDEIRREAGRQFDPSVAAAFLALLERGYA
jgi:putative nucleotidyltransferase with HDIG domain